MKKSYLLLAVLVFSVAAVGQPTRTPVDYLQKSKRQQTAAFITLGCGVATAVPGFILLSQTEPGWETVDWDKALGGSAFLLASAGWITASIILFVSSAGNRRKAGRVSLHINEPVLINTGLQQKMLPYSVGARIIIR